MQESCLYVEGATGYHCLRDVYEDCVKCTRGCTSSRDEIMIMAVLTYFGDYVRVKR